MADLVIDGDELVLHLSRAEKVEAIRGDLRTPLSTVSCAEVLDDAHQAADFVGFKAGTRISGTVEVGTIWGSHKKVFAAVHRDTPRGVRVKLESADQDEWVVGCADPEAVAATVNSGIQPPGRSGPNAR